MKKKLLFSTVAAAALLFTGAGFNKTEAASYNCNSTTQVTYKLATQEEAQKLIHQYMNQFNIQFPVQWNQVTTQKSVPCTLTQVPTQKQVQTQTKQSVQPTAKTKVTSQKATQQSQPSKVSTNKPTSSQPTQTASSVSAFEKKVVELTNAERAKQGLAPLTLDTALSKVARAKSQDMKDKNYFDHTSPTYGSPFAMMKSFGISYKSAGENIAMGQTTPEQVVQAWMNSQGHRENIMNSSFTHIGVGYVASGNYWTQMFIGK